MPIISSIVKSQSKQADGRYRVRYEYTLDDGRKFTIGPVNTIQSNINSLMADKAIQLEKSIIQSDAEEAVEKGIDTGNRQATTKQVYAVYLVKSLKISDPLESYLLLSKIAQKVQDLRLSIDQLVIQLELDKETIQEALAKWQYLNSNKSAILAYQTIKGEL